MEPVPTSRTTNLSMKPSDNSLAGGKMGHGVLEGGVDAPAYFQSISNFLCSVLVSTCEADAFGILV